MSDEDNYKVQVSLSAPPPAQYAKGAMANFRGASVSEVVEQLQDAQASGLLELASEVEAVWTAAAGLNASTQSVTPAQNSGQGGYGSNRSATAAGQSSSASHATVTPINQGVSTAPAPSCQHGVRQWKSGKGRTGDWFAWFCSAPKGQGCDPVWANADGSARD